MAFVVEDGTAKSDANSYQAVADFKTHHTDRGGDFSPYDDAAIQVALVQATDYIDKRFGRRFRGWSSSKDQALEWPRLDALDDSGYTFDAVPKQLLKATAEYTMLVLQLGRNLAPVPGTEFGIINPVTGAVVTTPSGAISGKKEVVGPIEETTDYESSNRPMVTTGNLTQRIPEYPQADLWIEELLRPSGSRRIVRG